MFQLHDINSFGSPDGVFNDAYIEPFILPMIKRSRVNVFPLLTVLRLPLR